jgi:NuA3 HAT complex component NTO1
LPKPNFRRVEIFEAFEQDKSVGLNYVDKSLSNVGYQETDRFIRPDKIYIRNNDGTVEDDPDILATLQHGGDDIGHLKVEYDMDEQDERWLEGINVERKAEGVEAIRPAIFEITITSIEKEWYALEKSKSLSLIFPRAHALTLIL